MDNLQLYVLELTKEDVQDLVEALDHVVKSQGLNVAERCSQLYRLLLSVTPKPLHDPQQMHVPKPVVQPQPVVQPEPVVQPQPVVQPEPVSYPEYVPTPEEIAEHEKMAKEKLEKELSELIGEKPKKSKSSSKKKTSKKK